jgi:glycosyltransferase involved in cell wall biosynthesis
VYQHRVPTHVIPNGVDVRYYESVRLGHCPPPDGLAAGPHAFVFVASFSHPPNAFAAKVILDQVYPRLRARYPDCRVLLVGRDPTPHMMKVAGRDPHVAVTGEVADVRPYLAAAKASIVPLQHGAGTRFKIVEAFAAGVPVVSTSKGDEGLDVVPGRHLLRADTPQQFADALHELFSAPSLRQRLIAAAFDLVRREYSREAVGQRVTRALQHLISQSPPRGGAVSASAG